MKLIVLILFVVCFFNIAYSQSKIQGKLETGVTIQRNGVLLEEDACVFSLSDGSMRGKWILQLDGKMKVYEVKELDGYYGIFPFSIKDLNIQTFEMKYGLKQYVLENDSSVYYKGNIVFQDIAGNVIDCFPIRLNVLPAMPVLKNATLECNGFDWESYLFTNPILNFYFTSSREERYVIRCGEEGCRSCATLLPYPSERVQNNAGVKVMLFDFAIVGWDDYFVLQVSNDYGSVVSQDTIRMYECVDDPELLKEYEKWLELETSIKTQSKDIVDVCYNQVEQTLYFRGLLGQKDIRILKIDGTLVMHVVTVEEKMVIPAFNGGIYIVYIVTNERIVNRKILIN